MKLALTYLIVPKMTRLRTRVSCGVFRRYAKSHLCKGFKGRKAEQQAVDGGTANPPLETEDQNGTESETLKKAAEASSGEETEMESNADGNASGAANTENLVV